MRVIVDNKIPFIKEAIEKIADSVIYTPGRDFTPELVKDADALIIRTRTRCNKELLEGSKVRFIATATIAPDRDCAQSRCRSCLTSRSPARCATAHASIRKRWPSPGRIETSEKSCRCRSMKQSSFSTRCRRSHTRSSSFRTSVWATSRLASPHPRFPAARRSASSS